MKIILKIFVMFMLASLPLISVASPDCPYAFLIKTKTLSQATQLTRDRWNLLSDSFMYNNRSWNIIFITEIASAKNNHDALLKGNDNFRHTDITNDDPVPQNSDGMSYCNYTSMTGKNRIAAASFVQDG